MNTVLAIGLLLTGVLWPLFVAFMLAFKPVRFFVLPLAPWAALPALVACLLVTPNEANWHFPGVLLGSTLGLDATGQMFLLLAAILWTIAGAYGSTYFAQPIQRARFYVFFLLAMTGNFGLIVALDPLGFYLGFSLMSFASYGLVVFDKSATALRAGRVYIILVVASEVILFSALLLAAQTGGAMTFEAVRTALIEADNRDIIILLGLIGFGIKAGLLGLHVWLPLAHPIAPTPASAVLSGTMIKAGLLGWLRLLPLGEIALPNWGVTVMVLGLAAAFYGVVVGLTQRNPKTLLAYSSVSQMGIMTMALGLGMLVPHTWVMVLPTITFYALHHGLSKAALFLGVGLTDNQHHLPQRWLWFTLSLPALALAGAPWTSGMYAKLQLNAHFIHAPAPWDTVLPWLLSASSLATALLMARLLYLVRPRTQSLSEAPANGLVWPWLTAITMALLIPSLLIPFTPRTLEFDDIHAVASLWPLVVAGLVSAVTLRKGWFKETQPLPPGDILYLITASLQRLKRLMTHWTNLPNLLLSLQSLLAKWHHSFKRTLAVLATATAEKLQQTENYLARWEIAGGLLLLIGLAISFTALLLVV